MTSLELLAQLRRRDILLWRDGDQLHYSAPEGALTADLRQAVRSQKAELLTLVAPRNGSAQPHTIPIQPRQQPLPLSFAQERLWFSAQIEGRQALYNEPWVLQLCGHLDLPALTAALRALEERHEILRTTFTVIDDAVYQKINEPRFTALPCQAITYTEPAAIQRAVMAAWQQPFDLVAGPLWRAQLLQCAPTEHRLIIVMHHSICDDWSFRIFLDELATLYGAKRSGAPNPLPPLPIQYADFAHWQRRYLQGATRERLLAYWRQQLTGAPPLLELPSDYPRPAQPRFVAARQSFVLPAALRQELQAISQVKQVTMFMTCLAAYVTLLYRYSGQEDLVIGVPSASRDRAEIEPLIGFFANTLPLRMQLSEQLTFDELLAQVKQHLLAAQEHQALPFEQLVEALAPERTLRYMPIVQLLFTWQMAQIAAFTDKTDLRFALLPLETVSAKFDLVLQIEEQGEQLVATWDYDTSLFAPATITRLNGHFLTLLAGLLANPQAPLHTLPLITAQERQQLLVEWNKTAVEHPLDQGVHQLFEAHATRTPHATALVYNGQTMSYGELNRRANQLAHYLIKRGVGPERIVGICIERSPEMVIGLLAIFKAGAAYLPLDANYPQERLTFMVEDADIALLLTQEPFMPRLPQAALQTHRSPYPHRTLVRLDRDAQAIAAECTENPTSQGQRAPRSSQLAYLLYTSGSTGQPKGVAVTQRNLTNFTCTEIRRFAFDGDSRVLQFAALSFDASLSEICTALCAGGSLYLPTPEQALPGPALADLLLQAGITHVKLPPSALAVLPKVAYPALQVLMTIGEACTVDQIAFWSRGRRFCNGYGPTEATIGITGAEGTDCTAAPPIGRPYDNTQIYVLDAHRHPVPIGVAGELYIGGEQIARGYWKRPQLTADKFIPAAHFPFAAQGLLYRTGDLVRYLPDGNLDFIGRIDQMVKLRGMRIELGEIETTLNQHALVQESVVIVHEYAAGDQRLVAYVVTPPPVGDMVGDVVGDVRGTLLTYLKHKLPPYMAPAALVLVAAFPTLPNGKVDRKALPLPSAEDWHSVPFVAPRTETEQIVAEIWADLLKQPQVGVYDNFFALGGHSLLVTEVCFRLQAVLGLAVGVRTIFEHPTIAALAEQLDEQTLAGVDETMLAHLLNEVAAA